MQTFTKKVFATKEDFKDKQESLIKDNIEITGINGGFKVFNVVKIEDLIEVECFYHETDEHYRAVGYAVTIESQYGFQDKPEIDKGFYPIWVGKCSSTAPITFEESYNDHSFANGLGDKAELLKVIRKGEVK